MNMFDAKAMLCQVENDGYAVQEGILSEWEIDELIDAIERQQDDGSLLRHGRIFAVRNLMDLPEISKLAESEPVRELALAVLGDTAFPVRGILFGKIPEANWKVPWHQDLRSRCGREKKSRDSVPGPSRLAFFTSSRLRQC